MKCLARRLKEARELKGFTQKEVSEALKVSIGTISGYERGYREPNLYMLQKLSEFYGISLSSLISEDNHSSNIGKVIKMRRKSLNWTQSDLSKAINVSPQVISNWERQYTSPSSEDIKMLAEAMNCTADYLLGKTDNPSETDGSAIERFFDDPELEMWYKDMPKEMDEDELRKLKQMWEIMKDK